MKKYPSKIGYGIMLFIFSVLVGSSIPVIWPPQWPFLLINLAIFAFLVHLFSNTYYIIDHNTLIIKSGFIINKKIDVTTIKRIAESGSIISAPALSFDRLNIVYGSQNSILISPKDKGGFIKHIIELNPEVVVQKKQGSA